MKTADEIKSKEDSLAALMNRILSEPLEPLKKAIHDSMENITEAGEKIINSNNSANADLEQRLQKLLNRLFGEVKDEVFPEHALNTQRQIKTLSDVNAKNLRESFEALMGGIDKNQEDVLSELEENRRLALKIIEALKQVKEESLPNHTENMRVQLEKFSEECFKRSDELIDFHKKSIDQVEFGFKASSDVILDEIRANKEILSFLQGSAKLVGGAIATQQRSQEANQQSLLEKLANATNERSAIQQSLVQLAHCHEMNVNSLARLQESSKSIVARLEDVGKNTVGIMDDHQAVLIRTLGEQNNALASRIAMMQDKLKTLTFMTGFFFASMLGYVGYDIWSKLI